MDVDAIVEKLRKLRALSHSSNEHEAELAAAKMQELMTAHRISELQLAGADHRDAGYLRQDYELDAGRWRLVLLNGICRANGARVCNLGDNRVAIVGRPGSLPVIVEAYQYLADVVDQLARDKWAAIKGATWENGRSWAGSFRLGAAERIMRRMAAAAREAASGAEITALILRDDAAASEAFRAEFPHTRKTAIRAGSGSGYSAGWEAGGNVGLTPSRKIGQGYRLTAGS